MPLTEPRNPMEFLNAQDFNPAPAAPYMASAPSFDKLLKEIIHFEETQGRMNAEIALRFEAIRRLANIDEAQLIATEKAILQERRAPAPEVTLDTVVQVTQQIVAEALAQNTEEIRALIHEVLRPAPITSPQDPMAQPHHYQDTEEQLDEQPLTAPGKSVARDIAEELRGIRAEAPAAEPDFVAKAEAAAIARPGKRKDQPAPDWRGKGKGH